MESNRFHFNLLIPEDGLPPFEFTLAHPAICVAVTSRESLRALSENWQAAGVYVLLGRPDASGSWDGYVGMARKLKKRIGDHVANKNFWYRAVLVRRDTSNGFHTAQAGWLEGRVHEALEESNGVTLRNKGVPDDETLPRSEQRALTEIVPPLTCLLELLGHSLGSQLDHPSPSGDAHKPNEPYQPSRRVTIRDLIEAGHLKVGAKLVPIDPRWSRPGCVTNDGSIQVDTSTHSSPSAAAKAVTGRKAEPGWDFWALDTPDGTSLSELRERLRAGAAPEAESSRPPLRQEPEPDEPDPPKRRVQVGDLIHAGLLTPGTQLVSTSRKYPGTAGVLPDGRVERDGHAYNSPSAAAVAVTRQPTNGWSFWAVESSGEKLAEVRARLPNVAQES